MMEGAVASWLVRSTPERAVRFRALTGNTVLCSWVRHFTLTVPLSTQVYKWVPANLMLGVTLRWTSISSTGEYKYSQSLHATETAISSGLMGHLARMQTVFFYLYKCEIVISSRKVSRFPLHTRASLEWMFSYICCICVHSDLDTAPLFVGMRERSIDINIKFHHRLVIVIIIIIARDCDVCLNVSMLFET